MQREKFGTRLGFILMSAGCAIGVGNVWKFPYLAGENGGGAFVLIYLIFLFLLGIPVMVVEFALGRASQKSPVKLYNKLEKPGQKWHIHGYFAFLGNIFLMMFYTVVCGWMFYYFIQTARGNFVGLDTEGVGAAFNSLLASPSTLVIYTAVVVILGCLICAFSLQGGLEKITKYMMLLLLAIMVVLAIHSFTMDGAKEGLSFYLKPDFSKVTGSVVVAAMNQAFFTLSLGIGAMAIFGSYIGKERSLLGESVNVVILDTFVAIVSGLIIFPACFTYGVDSASGPSLIFVTLPNIFNNMSNGRLWGALFFLFMSFAAFSTILAVFENISACLRDLTGWDRKKTSIVLCIGLFLLSLPCALGFNLWAGVTPFGEGTGIMDLEDFIVSNCLLPLGSLIFVLFAVLKKGWGWDNFIKEANTGKGLKMKNWMKNYMLIAIPIIIFVIFVMGILTFFHIV